MKKYVNPARLRALIMLSFFTYTSVHTMATEPAKPTSISHEDVPDVKRLTGEFKKLSISHVATKRKDMPYYIGEYKAREAFKNMLKSGLLTPQKLIDFLADLALEDITFLNPKPDTKIAAHDLSIFIKKFMLNVNIRDGLGNSALHYVCMLDHNSPKDIRPALLEALLITGAEINSLNVCNLSPLNIALRNRFTYGIQRLLACENLIVTSDSKKYPMQPLVHDLLNNHPINSNPALRACDPGLHEYHVYNEALQDLLNKKADVTLCDEDGETVFDILKKHKNIPKRLKKSIFRTCESHDKGTPHNDAKSQPPISASIQEALIKLKTELLLAHEAQRLGPKKVVLLLEEFASNDGYQVTEESLAQEIRSWGIDIPTIIDESQNTALHYAFMPNYIFPGSGLKFRLFIIKTLIALGVNILRPNSDHKSPRDIALDNKFSYYFCFIKTL